ncbi:MAG: GGDEF domain-containing protein [Lachnospiraceae bacterium]|nr:GGDEF domain-containing protein [Lachnospiraceae bacterium]
MFFINRPITVNIFQAISTVLFCYFSMKNKPSYYYNIDILNGISFFFVGSAVNFHSLSLKLRDISIQGHLKSQRDTDALTQIYNRGGIEQIIRDYLAFQKTPAAMVLLDIDNFKTINDTFGHESGDALLIETANILQSHFRKEDYVGRLGGDEFVVFLPGFVNPDSLSNKLGNLVQILNRTLIGDSGTYSISASIGVALYPKDADNYDELYKRADEAMYKIKKSGKSGFVIYDKAL